MVIQHLKNGLKIEGEIKGLYFRGVVIEMGGACFAFGLKVGSRVITPVKNIAPDRIYKEVVQ